MKLLSKTIEVYLETAVYVEDFDKLLDHLEEAINTVQEARREVVNRDNLNKQEDE